MSDYILAEYFFGAVIVAFFCAVNYSSRQLHNIWGSRAQAFLIVIGKPQPIYCLHNGDPNWYTTSIIINLDNHSNSFSPIIYVIFLRIRQLRVSRQAHQLSSAPGKGYNQSVPSLVCYIRFQDWIQKFRGHSWKVLEQGLKQYTSKYILKDIMIISRGNWYKAMRNKVGSEIELVKLLAYQMNCTLNT